MTKTVTIGSKVKIKDEHGVEHDALVTNGFPEVFTYDDAGQVFQAINVVFVSADPAKTDCYGRQTEHLTSVMHKSVSGECPGRFWWQE